MDNSSPPSFTPSPLGDSPVDIPIDARVLIKERDGYKRKLHEVSLELETTKEALATLLKGMAGL